MIPPASHYEIPGLAPHSYWPHASRGHTGQSSAENLSSGRTTFVSSGSSEIALLYSNRRSERVLASALWGNASAAKQTGTAATSDLGLLLSLLVSGLPQPVPANDFVRCIEAAEFALHPFLNTDFAEGSAPEQTSVAVRPATAQTSPFFDGLALAAIWNEFLRSNFERVAALPTPLDGYEKYARSDWDGFGAEPITRETLNAARSILNNLPPPFTDPHVAPGADGAIGLYWSDDVRAQFSSLCIDVGPGAKWRAYWRIADGTFGRVPSQRLVARNTQEIIALLNKLRG
jgi:hypothetical protein